MRARGVVQNSALALAGDLAAKGGLAAVTFVVARALSTPEFAALAAAMAAATVLTAVLDLGAQTLLTRDGIEGPGTRGSLLTALALARLPLLGLALAGAAAFGLATGHLAIALATVLLALAASAQLSLSGALRSAQDLRPEATTRLAAGVLMVGAAIAAAAIAPRALAVLLAVTAANVVALVPMIRATRRSTAAGPRVPAGRALRSAMPLGAMAIATLGYYRAGTIALSALSSSTQTARFAAASTVAWGLLCVGNALTTALLPRLAAVPSNRARADLTRRATLWITACSALMGLAVAIFARQILTVLFGARYAAAAPTLALLALATILIAPAGVLGTALIACRRLRVLGLQVGCSLAVNLVALGLLAPRLGAPGAAVATLACETLALAILIPAAVRALPGLLGGSVGATRIPTDLAAGPMR